MEFRWNDWNVSHIAEHGITPEMAEHVVDHARRPYPEYIGDDKYRARGQAQGGRYIQVIFTFSPASIVYVLHARPLTANEVSQYRRRTR